MSVKRKYDVVSEQERKLCAEEIIARIDESDTPGLIAADDIIGIVIEHYGAAIYDKALVDVKNILQTKAQDASIEIDLLSNR
jgi:hypothetical protein